MRHVDNQDSGSDESFVVLDDGEGHISPDELAGTLAPLVLVGEEPCTTAWLLCFDVASCRALGCEEPLGSPNEATRSDGAVLASPEAVLRSDEEPTSPEDTAQQFSPLPFNFMPSLSPPARLSLTPGSFERLSPFTDVAPSALEGDLPLPQLQAKSDIVLLELARDTAARACISAIHRRPEAAWDAHKVPDLQACTPSSDGGQARSPCGIGYPNPSASFHSTECSVTVSAAWPALSAGPFALTPTRPPGDRLDQRAQHPRHQRRRWVEEPGPLHASHDPRALRAADQQKLKANFKRNFQKVSAQEARSQRGARAHQEIRFRLRDQEIERECRRTENSWHRDQDARHSQSLRRREELATSGEETLNRLYGRMPLYDASLTTDDWAGEEVGMGSCSVAEAWEQVTVRFGEESRPPMPATQGRRLTADEAAARLEPPGPECLERFMPTYQASLGRRVVPELAQLASPMVSAPISLIPSRRPRSKGSHGDAGSTHGTAFSTGDACQTPPPPGPPPGRAAWQSTKNPWRGKKQVASAQHMVRALVAKGTAKVPPIRPPVASAAVPARPFKGPPIFIRNRQCLPPVVPSHPVQPAHLHLPEPP